MISNTNLIKSCNGNVLRVHEKRHEITDCLKKSLNTYFKGIGFNKVVVSNFNNGDLRINAHKSSLKGFNLEKLFKAYDLKFNVTNETETFISYVIYVFDG